MQLEEGNSLAEFWKQAEEGNVDAFLPLVDELVDAGLVVPEGEEIKKGQVGAGELVEMAHYIMGSTDMRFVMLCISNYQMLLAKIKRNQIKKGD